MSTKELQLQFVQEVLNARPEENELFKEFDRLVHHDFVEYADGNSTYHQKSASLMRLQEICRQLELVVADSQFHQKGQVAVAGCFSSGKSAFINSFFQRAQKQEGVRLPIDSTPTTSIASYVVDGPPSVRGFSYEGGRVDISPQLFRMFRHGQEDGFEFNVKKIVSRIVVSTPWSVEFPHICLVDTPGFDSGTDQMGSDDSAALAAIAEADGVVWCVSVEAGTLTDMDCELLQQLRELNPRLRLYLVLTHADLKSLEECQDILLEVADTLEAEGIEVEGICPYCSKQGVGSQDESLRNAGRGMGLEDFLRGIPPRSMRERLLEPIQEVFRGYREADRKRIAVLEQERKDLNVIGNLYTAEVDGLEATVSRLKARLAALGDDAGERIEEEEKKREVAETAGGAAWVSLSDVHAAWQSLSERVKETIEAFVTLIAGLETELQQDPELQESLREVVEILLHQIYCDSFDRYETMPDFESWLSYVQQENVQEVVYDYLSRLASWESPAESLPEHLAPWESPVESLPERLAVWRRQLAEEIAVHERDMQEADALCGKMTGLVEKIFGGQQDCWIGGTGPGGGIVFHGSRAYEVSVKEKVRPYFTAIVEEIEASVEDDDFDNMFDDLAEKIGGTSKELAQRFLSWLREVFEHCEITETELGGGYVQLQFVSEVPQFSYAVKMEREDDLYEKFLGYLTVEYLSEEKRGDDFITGATGPGGGILLHNAGDVYEVSKVLYAGDFDEEVSEVLGEPDSDSRPGSWGAAMWAVRGYRDGGFGGWWLPTREELNLVYQKLRKPGIITDDEWFWCDDGDDDDNHRAQCFADGSWSLDSDEYTGNYVRAIRKLYSAHLREVIGRPGPGGGIVFATYDELAYEVSEMLGCYQWDEAKRVAEGYRGGGFSDWRLPTKEELDLVYQRLRKPGIITDFLRLWSSSQFYNHGHWAQRFDDGGQDGISGSDGAVRAIRVFNIEGAGVCVEEKGACVKEKVRPYFTATVEEMEASVEDDDFDMFDDLAEKIGGTSKELAQRFLSWLREVFEHCEITETELGGGYVQIQFASETHRLTHTTKLEKEDDLYEMFWNSLGDMLVDDERRGYYDFIIGATGPGGGILFHNAGNVYEVSEVLGKYTWDEAYDAADEYGGGGFSNWRLPTKEELDLVYQKLRKPGIITDDEWFWCDEGVGDYSVTLCFADGSWGIDSDEYPGNYVRAIREL